MPHIARTSSKLLARVRRITGQLVAIENAIENEAECAPILQQVAAARGAINGLMGELLEEHMKEHVARPELSHEARANGAEELATVIRRYMR